jgi:thioredoxin 1
MKILKTMAVLAPLIALSCLARAEEPSIRVTDVSAQPSADAPVSDIQPTAKKLPRLVDLGASKCVPCKMMAPILDDLKKEYAGQMDVEFLDVWKNPDAGKQYGIKIIPTQIFFNADGKEIFRHEGFFGREDILAKWKELGVEFVLN